MSGMPLFLWGVYPYLVLTVFVIVLIVRMRNDPFGWTSKSSEFLEKRWLRWGSLLFHWGILFVVAGHVAGLLIPIQWHRGMGISDEIYHAIAVWAGSLAGLAAGVGALILLFRRLLDRRIRVTSTPGDLLSIVMITLVIMTGMTATLFNGLDHSGFDYRETISPWLRGVLLLQPDPSLMETVPITFKIHIVLAFALFALWPFTRLVHAFSFPLWYLRRSYVVYRRRGHRPSSQSMEKSVTH